MAAAQMQWAAKSPENKRVHFPIGSPMLCRFVTPFLPSTDADGVAGSAS